MIWFIFNVSMSFQPIPKNPQSNKYFLVKFFCRVTFYTANLNFSEDSTDQIHIFPVERSAKIGWNQLRYNLYKQSNTHYFETKCFVIS